MRHPSHVGKLDMHDMQALIDTQFKIDQSYVSPLYKRSIWQIEEWSFYIKDLSIKIEATSKK